MYTMTPMHTLGMEWHMEELKRVARHIKFISMSKTFFGCREGVGSSRGGEREREAG
jgi:hypothetical protein